MCALYGKVDYWDHRYSKTESSEPCEWYCSYKQLAELLSHTSLSGNGISSSGHRTANTDAALIQSSNNQFLFNNDTKCGNKNIPSVNSNTSFVPSTYKFPDRSSARVLIVGCGNSQLPIDMIHDGWIGGIVGIDFSSVVIHQMQNNIMMNESIRSIAIQHQRQPNQLLKYICADVTRPLLGHVDGASFDLIICKGTLDAILCSPSSKSNAMQLIQQCEQLLVPGHGVLCIVTTGNPDSRFEYLEYQNDITHYWRNVSIHPIRLMANKSLPDFFCYICRKRLDIKNESNSSDLGIVTTGKENLQNPK